MVERKVGRKILGRRVGLKVDRQVRVCRQVGKQVKGIVGRREGRYWKDLCRLAVI